MTLKWLALTMMGGGLSSCVASFLIDQYTSFRHRSGILESILFFVGILSFLIGVMVMLVDIIIQVP